MSQQVLQAAYGHFANWPAGRQQFEALLDPDVLWIETDTDLNPGNYQGKADVMAHLDDIQGHVASVSLVSVTQKPGGWETRDNMQVQGHDLHCCISDIDFNGDLIKRVLHCKNHGPDSEGPCPD
ncbi:MAG TPA: hypothetical protein VJS45_18855 [Acidimicrobiia bacterium]|nr:hypothetical protein [Acidimicrobiia bacterium]